MKKLFLSLALGLLFAFGVNAQNAQGNWYVGTGDVANVAWTDWAVSPTIGYAITDNIVLGGSVSHVAGEDMDLDFNVKYFFKGYFADINLDGFSTEGMVFGIGKMFTVRNNVYVDPCVVYNAGDETVNLTLGFGFKF